MRTIIPDAMVMRVPGISPETAQAAAHFAATEAKRLAPKLTGAGAASIEPYWGEDYFGFTWLEPRMWFQEEGISAFTMHRLQGKVIPMWIDDPRGEEAKKYPKAKKRTTESGRRQVLIFRRVAYRGQRKMVRRKVGGVTREVSVPRSYPGAPGRIVRREAAAPWTTPGRVGGQIAKGNVGVRWRHPGLQGRGFMREALDRTCSAFGVTRYPAVPLQVNKAA